MSVKLKGNTLLIDMEGDIDHHMAALLREESDEVLNRSYVREVVFDFARTKFMDSSGIGLIMGRYRQAGYNDATVSLVNVSAGIDRMLEMSGLYKIIKDVKRIKEE